MAEPQILERPATVSKPPVGLAIVAVVGPAFVWTAEYIGSGEVILATRTGAILGTSAIWAIVMGIFLKYWIGMSGARYTVCTGEGMMDMFARIPGPRNWVVWIVVLGQLVMAAVSIGSIASAAGIFVSALIPVSPYLAGWGVTIFALLVVWSGVFDVLKMVMSIFVAMTVLGVVYVALHVMPEMSALLAGLIPSVPPVPEWARVEGSNATGWDELLPLIGWGAGGFASQVWYTYWVLGAGYGAAEGRSYGIPADEERLRRLTSEDGRRLKGWCRVVYTDATVAMCIGIVVTISFLIAGAGVLGAREVAPDGPSVALTLSTLFSDRWGALGGTLFLMGGAAALISTQVGQLAGWPRLLADGFRICVPAFRRKFEWKQQFRLFLVLFFMTNMVIVFTLGMQPVVLVKLGAVLDGLLLTPLQAAWVAIGLFVIMPRMLSPEAAEHVRPHWIFAVGLGIAFLVFGYFCIVQVPRVLF